MAKKDIEGDARDPAYVALGQRVAEVRAEREMSKEELARRSELSPAYIWRIEDGRQNVQLRTLIRIAQGLGTTVAELTAGLEAKIAATGTIPGVTTGKGA
ncbi:helix-turn-helix domain-containing protein [Sphingomonas sp. Leaf412]|uniref:helix-turn-helix domain-containing protein n=1 Tax=Sphingomonas sp. Leaf412 TaxID=1736370 RepID=UPI000B272400|nr:helix-turn-helix transcriptional regulator [Sphingomonas sp. Leaf412]